MPASSDMLADEVAYGSGSWAFLDGEGQQVLAGESMAVDVMADGAWMIHRHFAAVKAKVEVE